MKFLIQYKNIFRFLVAKLLYIYNCLSVCQVYGENAIFSAPIKDRGLIFFLCRFLSFTTISILKIFCLHVCRLGYKRHKSKSIFYLLKSFVILCPIMIFALSFFNFLFFIKIHIYGCCNPCFFSIQPWAFLGIR